MSSECSNKVSQEKKALLSLKNGLLFVLISMPLTYKLVNSLTKRIGFQVSDDNGCPTPVGLAVHTLVFTLLVFISMQIKW